MRRSVRTDLEQRTRGERPEILQRHRRQRIVVADDGQRFEVQPLPLRETQTLDALDVRFSAAARHRVVPEKPPFGHRAAAHEKRRVDAMALEDRRGQRGGAAVPVVERHEHGPGGQRRALQHRVTEILDRNRRAAPRDELAVRRQLAHAHVELFKWIAPRRRVVRTHRVVTQHDGARKPRRRQPAAIVAGRLERPLHARADGGVHALRAAKWTCWYRVVTCPRGRSSRASSPHTASTVKPAVSSWAMVCDGGAENRSWCPPPSA